MNVAKQLYQIQEVDQQIESIEKSLGWVMSQLGENQAVVKAQAELASQQQCLDELKHRQQSAEWEIDDLGSKISPLEQKLYGGQIKNPKELANLEHEVDGLKAKRSQSEDAVLEMMYQVEQFTSSVATMNSELQRLEVEWLSRQKQLSSEVEQLEATLSDLRQKRESLTAQIDSKVVELYSRIKMQKGTAVAKVEQGICHGCRISLPITELQKARGGSIVQCSSCGRILFLA